jgi:hypothetical protein
MFADHLFDTAGNLAAKALSVATCQAHSGSNDTRSAMQIQTIGDARRLDQVPHTCYTAMLNR